ncbi:MAG: phosphonate ABC transporter, permease protein PhnE [Bacillota bacterium]
MSSNDYNWQLKGISRVLKELLFWAAGIWLFIYCWNILSARTMWPFVYDGAEQASKLLFRMFPPNWPYFFELLRPIWDTITIATIGTLAAVIFSLFVAYLAAENTTPHPTLRYFALLIIVTSRSVSSLIWAIILVIILGPGVLAGIIAISFRSIGFVSKLLYESIEEIDKNQVEAVAATGASKFSTLIYSVVPQVFPTFIGTSIYRWDINIRESTVVGLVGAGGIGLQLNEAILGLKWPDAIIIFMMILSLVLFSEFFSARIRKIII